MNSIRLLVITLSLLLVPVISAASNVQKASLSADEIIKRAAANEEKLKAAQGEYLYRLDILVQILGEAGSIRDQLHRVSEMTYDDLGNRIEKIIEYPPSRLTSAIGVLNVDFENLLGVSPFFLTTQSLSSYSIKLIERQKIDDLNVYLFQVEPADAKLAKPKDRGDHLFSGKIWIDEQDFQIVKMEGRAQVAKDEKSRFAKFECYRENLDGDLWMPSMVYANDVLEYPKYDIPLKIVIKYTGYKRNQKKG